MTTVRWLLGLLLLFGCGVPTPPSVPDLAARASGGDGRAAGALVDLLGAGTPADTRSAAYQALLAVGAPAGPAILGACRDPDPRRREHALALAANLRLAGGLDEALRALADPSFPRRYVAAWALGELRDPRATEALVSALAAPPGVAREAARALVKLGAGTVPALVEAAGALPPAARGYAVRTLGELKDPRGAAALGRALEDPALRADAAWALGKLGDPAAAPRLLGTLADPDWRVRLEAARSLGLLESREAEGALDRLRGEDPEPAVRTWAARSLSVLRGTPQTYRDHQGAWVEPESYYR